RKYRTNKPSPLIAEHEIVSLPSASSLAALRRELADRAPAPKTVAVIADPGFEESDERVKKNGGEVFTPGGKKGGRGGAADERFWAGACSLADHADPPR